MVFDNKITDAQRQNYDAWSSPTLLFKIVDFDPDDVGDDLDSSGESEDGDAPGAGAQTGAGTRTGEGVQPTTRTSTISNRLATTKTPDNSGEGEIGKTR